MNRHIEDFRRAVTAGARVEALARNYGLLKGPDESDAELSSRLEMYMGSYGPFLDFENRNGKWERADCRSCNGTGHQDSWTGMGMSCLMCNGSGKC